MKTEKPLTENVMAAKTSQGMLVSEDLKVTNHDNNSIESNYHTNAPHSVLNSKHEARTKP